MKSHEFKTPTEILEYIKREIKNYIGTYDEDRIIYSYRRMTVEEIAQEVYLKVLVSTEKPNKKFIRQAVIFVCIDLYRKTSEVCPGDYEYDLPTSGGLGTLEDLMELTTFKDRDKSIVSLLIQGYKNSEIMQILNIPRMSYYTALKRLKVPRT